MNRITIVGVAFVFRDNDEQLESDPAILSCLNGYIYGDERFTDYLGGSKAEDALAKTLTPSGYLRFTYDGQADHLMAITEYEAIRLLDEDELSLLVAYTMGQWSDGVGENFACERPLGLGLSVQCQTDSPPTVRQHPH